MKTMTTKTLGNNNTRVLLNQISQFTKDNFDYLWECGLRITEEDSIKMEYFPENYYTLRRFNLVNVDVSNTEYPSYTCRASSYLCRVREGTGIKNIHLQSLSKNDSDFVTDEMLLQIIDALNQLMEIGKRELGNLKLVIEQV